MKRYEKMSKEEIIRAYPLKEGVCIDNGVKCFAYDNCDKSGKYCNQFVATKLNHEIETKPRIALINTPAELRKAVYEKWECLPYEVETMTLVNWLKEEVEV